MTPLPPAGMGEKLSGTVLLVEDDDFFRRMLRRVIEGFGFDVIEARDADSALALARSHEGPIHVLLTDVVMPRMNGRRLLESIAGIRPGIRVAFMSGYTDDVLGPQDVMDGEVPFLQKPFTMDALREVLAALIRA